MYWKSDEATTNNENDIGTYIYIKLKKKKINNYYNKISNSIT